MTRARRLVFLVGGLAGLAAAAMALPRRDGQVQDRFNHPKHAKLFPLCTSCHGGVVDSGAPLYPVLRDCTACHDGTIQARVEFLPRSAPVATNLRFTHEVHARSALRGDPSDSTIGVRCQACHTVPAAERMAVQLAVVGNCLDCHRLPPDHLAAPDSACAACHVPLTEAPRLSRADVAGFPEPGSHLAPDFPFEGHGRLAEKAGVAAVAAGCATCHARDFCVTCHVNAPEVGAIQALGPDDRSTALAATLPTPASHGSATFLTSHAKAASASGASCSTCHIRDSCTACHVGVAPRRVDALPAAGPGRGAGATVERTAPLTHTWTFREGHGPEATARPSSCEGCHVRTQCLDCHRPDAAASPARQGYHPDGFLTRHPAAAYSREANCADCHNPGQFCQTCHVQAGLTSRAARIGARGFHDGYPAFGLGHGQAARQQLESCASCHAERDCTACHSAVPGGFRFSPHGPRFDAERLRKKNPSVCVACHGRDIPGVVR